MITAIDSSVLWAIVKRESGWESWDNALLHAAAEGPLLICPIAFAELAHSARDESTLLNSLSAMAITYDEISPTTAFTCGQIFKRYRQAGGPCQHLAPDFIIATHALIQADRLAAIDRGYLRKWFPGLTLLQPKPR